MKVLVKKAMSKANIASCNRHFTNVFNLLTNSMSNLVRNAARAVYWYLQIYLKYVRFSHKNKYVILTFSHLFFVYLETLLITCLKLVSQFLMGPPAKTEAL